jgi:putative tryptophan/tyrosine transport system substrate-binding protein
MTVTFGRRELLAALGGAAALWPLAARAQQSDRVRRVGVLNPFAENDPEVQAHITSFRQALQKLGWTDGRNLRIHYRWGEANPERLRAHAAELVALEPDVILVSSPLALQPLQKETRSIPIVFTGVSDPAGSGFIASLAHPGGNITGFAVAEFSMYGKHLELLKEVAPHVVRVAVMMNPEQVPQAGNWRAIETVAPSFRVQLTAAHVRDSVEIERAIDAFARESNGGLIVLPSALTIVHRGLIIALAARHRLPAVYAFRQFVVDGGLMSYGVDLVDQYRQAASYVDRILRGEKPADLPVQQPTQFSLIINLKTAKALGLDVPWILQQRADEVIE